MSNKFKITLGRLPDFKLPVKFNLPNGVEAQVVFTVRHLKSDEIQEMYNKGDMKDQDFITGLASGWDLEEEFNSENALELVKLFPGCAVALTQSYMQALAGIKVKN